MGFPSAPSLFLSLSLSLPLHLPSERLQGQSQMVINRDEQKHPRSPSLCLQAEATLCASRYWGRQRTRKNTEFSCQFCDFGSTQWRLESKKEHKKHEADKRRQYHQNQKVAEFTVNVNMRSKWGDERRTCDWNVILSTRQQHANTTQETKHQWFVSWHCESTDASCTLFCPVF